MGYRSLWISRTEDSLAVCLAGRLILVDVPSKVTTVAPPITIGGGCYDVVFSRDATAVIVSTPLGFRSIAILDLTSHDRLFDFEDFKIERHQIPKTGGSFLRLSDRRCREIAWSLNDSIIAGVVAVGAKDCLYMWDGSNGRLRSKWCSETRLKMVEITADARYCLSMTLNDGASEVGGTQVVLVDVDSGKVVSSLSLPKAGRGSRFHGLGVQRSGDGKMYFYDGVGTAFCISVGLSSD